MLNRSAYLTFVRSAVFSRTESSEDTWLRRRSVAVSSVGVLGQRVAPTERPGYNTRLNTPSGYSVIPASPACS